MRLLQHGYSVNTTIRSHTAGGNKGISFLTNLPRASERLAVFPADLDNPGSFAPAIEGCVGVFHVAHPMDLEGRETEGTITERSVRATLGILRACLDSKTVRRFVYTSGAATVMYHNEDKCSIDDVLDEESWSDLDYVRSSNMFGASYCISKTVTERAVLEFGEKHSSLGVVIVLPSLINGPFICPGLPASVKGSLAVLGNDKLFKYYEKTPFVHVNDVASAHVFLFEYPEAKGRYICSAVEITQELCETVSKKYPEFHIPAPEYLGNRSAKIASLSSRKLLVAGFVYKYGIEEMFDGAIECCKQKDLF